jgi:heme exporter protein A
MRLIGDKLSAARGARTLFAGLSFSVASGEALLVMGPNGAGKTTLLRTIAGFAQPGSGRVVLDGGKPDHLLGEQCHYLGHANAIKGALTVGENVTFWARFLDGTMARIDAALATFGLSALRDIPAAYLSAGQKRRLALARLLLADRPVWLLDEPTASLDVAAQDALMSAARTHLGAGGIMLVATHVPLGLGTSRELHLGTAAQAA